MSKRVTGAPLIVGVQSLPSAPMKTEACWPERSSLSGWKPLKSAAAAGRSPAALRGTTCGQACGRAGNLSVKVRSRKPARETVTAR